MANLALLYVLLISAGCTAWPFQERERTSIIIPAMRVAAVREIGLGAKQADNNEQVRLTEQLASQIRTEPDPLVRLAIQESIAQFSTPLARSVLIAGLNDQDMDVRIACCERLGGRSDPSVVSALRGVLEAKEELDVRLAAIDALGRISSTESVAALALALKDRDPAVQYAAVVSLKAASGQDYGNDVAAWRKYTESDQPQISAASKNKSWLPFY
ncbi:MAG: HEAT repeat domain-containing protein [Pirellulales bacterium]|nr:HEAT repeat domain-containing protein [Pirellulales bacterium]